VTAWVKTAKAQTEQKLSALRPKNRPSPTHMFSLASLETNSAPNKSGRVPLVAAFVMVLWDLTMDPIAATVQKQWIWHDGEAILACPLSTIWVGCSVFTRLSNFLRSTSPVRGLPRNRKSDLIRRIEGTGINRRPHTRLRVALQHRLPSMFGFEENAKAGGLMSYSADILDLYRRSAAYIDKILRGAKPSELPVEQASKYKLIINLKTAKTLGLEIPQTLLARADEVIE
jgi:ABC transporter substrate binding protein